MSYRYSKPQQIPTPPGGHRRRSPSAARSPYARYAPDGPAASGGWVPGWASDPQRPRSSASHCSNGSDLLFPMDSERGSNASSSSSSSRRGSVEPPLLYGVPDGPDAHLHLPVCGVCGQRYYGPAPARVQQPSRGRARREDVELCPVCQRDAWQREQNVARRPLPTGGDPTFSPPSRRRRESQASTQTFCYEVPTPTRSGPMPVPAPARGTSPRAASSAPRSRRAVAGPSTHVLVDPFPSYGRRPIPHHRPSQPRHALGTGPWTDPGTLPPSTPVIGAYHPPYQLPQLITQLQRPPVPASNVSRPGDPFGIASAPPASHMWRRS